MTSKYKPNTNYVYERVDGIVYAREAGSDPSTRFEIGRNYDHRTHDSRPLHEQLKEDELWGKIRRAARTNPVLQAELDRVIMLYHLSKDYGKSKNKS